MTKHGLRRVTTLLEVGAHCLECRWRSDAANAQATAAQHARRHGHEVNVVTSWSHRYLPPR